jgi:uroporphyrinogen decarboxylase
VKSVVHSSAATTFAATMQTFKNSVLVDTLAGKPCDRYPVWAMRQAGRVLKEYRDVRAKAGSFINLVKSPELAAEVTIQPVDLLGVDAAIIFSDILVIPEAMGFPYLMEESKGPVFPNTIKSQADADKLEDQIDVNDRLGYVLEAIKVTKKELNNRVPLIGFAGAPLTILTYLIEGKGSKTFSEARKLLYTQPDLCHKALDKITTVTIQYLQAQVKAGANVVQLFDSWAGIFEPEQYSRFGVPYLERISKALSGTVPVILFPKGAWMALPQLAASDCTALGIDWNITMDKARELVGNDKILQGNLDPCALYGNMVDVKQITLKMLRSFAGKNHIANLGHGVYPDTDPEKLKCFIETVKEFKKEPLT